MKELVWALTELVAATSAIAALCNYFARNGIVSTVTAIGMTLLLWYWLVARHDAFWTIAAITVVPIVIITAMGVALLAQTIREADRE